MANQKVSAMTAASALTAAELLHVVQGGADRKATVQQILDAISGLGAAQSNRVTGAVNKTNDAASAIESQLAVTLQPGTYLVATALYASWGLGGFKADLGAGTAVLSATNFAVGLQILQSDQLTTVLLDTSASPQSIATTPTSADDGHVVGLSVVTVQTAGTYGVRWAQRVSHADATTLQDGFVVAVGILS